MSVIEVPRSTGSTISHGVYDADSEVGPSTVRFCLFGPIEVRTATRRIGVSDFPSRKVKQVCQLLVSAAGRSVSKDTLIDELWGDKLPRNPSAVVDHTLSLLRSLVVADDGSQPILTERGRYRIDLSVAEVDLIRFDELVGSESVDARTVPLSQLLTAVKLAGGQVLEDEMYAPWAHDLRERYTHRVQRLLLDIARDALVHDDPRLALDMAGRARAESLVVLEEGFALCISALIRLDRRHDARAMMLDLERRMSEELGAELAPETAMLRSILRETRGLLRTDQVLVESRISGRLETLPFVGRDPEIAAIDAAIARTRNGACEVVVVQGSGGVGKTALLGAVAQRADCDVRSFACLRSDAGYPLFVAHRLMRSLATESTLGALPPLGDTVPVVFTRLAEIIDRLGPMVILLDDVQWADQESLAVLAGVTHQRETQSLLVVATRLLTRCDDDVPAIAPSRSAMIELGPLERAVVDALPIESGWDETGGHPGLLAACIEAARTGGRLGVAAIADILEWVGAAESPQRVALEAAATMGQTFDTHDLAHRLGLSERWTRDLLADLACRHLVRVVDPAAGLWEFQAQVMRRVLCAHVGDQRLHG